MSQFWQRLGRWWRRKNVPAAIAGSAWPGPAALDAYRRHRAPTSLELLGELKNTAWTCASINAAVCAALPPRLFISTGPGQPPPHCLTRHLDPTTRERLRAARPLLVKTSAIAEVLDHPLLTLLRQVNPVHNSFDLWELTELYLEVHGCAYWLLEDDPLTGLPGRIWILPNQQVTPRRAPDSPRLVDAYEFRGRQLEQLPPERVIAFRFPDPRDPYSSGQSPLRACFEQVQLSSEYAALKRSLYDNTGLPSVVLTPAEVVGEEEKTRLEEQWRQKFQRGGQGQALVAESAWKVEVLHHSMGDLAALADHKATKEDIANAFQVPLPFLSADTNLANMQAANHLHRTLAIAPRLRRRDEKLNEQLLPRFDPEGRLFLATDDPTPANHEFTLRQEQSDLRLGVRTINEVRAARGLTPVPWGDRPKNE